MNRLLILALFFYSNFLMADVPMPHSGHISTGGAPYNQKGYFKFSILNASGESIWNHDGSSTMPPSGHLELDVVNGFYSLHLGDDSISGMSPLSAQILRDVEKAGLRVWFSSEHNGTFEQVGVDLAMGAAPFALVSELSRGSPEIEQRLLEIEKILENITAKNMDPLLLVEMGYRKLSTRELIGFSLPEIDLSGADFTDAIISDANLTSANLDNIDLEGGEIVDANLSLSSLEYANLTSSTVSGSSLQGVTATGVSLSRGQINSVDWSGADLSLADLSDATLEDSNFSSASFLGASLLDSTFINCSFRNASLVTIDSLNAVFTDCDLSDATISGYLTGADFQNANLTNTDFSGADLTGANLTGATGFSPDAHSNVIYFGTILPDGTERTD